MTTARLVADTRCLLGEGPHIGADGAVWWVDIAGRAIHRWHPSDDAHAMNGIEKWHLPVRPSALAERADGTYTVATDGGLARFDPSTGALTLGPELEPDRPGNRPNDGKVGPDGRFWVATMREDDGEPTGALYAIAPDGSAKRYLDGIGIGNTLAWSPKGDALYFADSRAGLIRRYAFGSEGPHDPAVFAKPGDGAAPDGSAMDEHGCLWNAQWDGGRVVRYAPDGTIDRVVTVPVDRPTSCAFGGPDGTTLFITSARIDLDADALARQPHAGGLFAAEVGVRGVPVPLFGA